VIASFLDAARRSAHLSSAVKGATATWLSGFRRAASPSFRLLGHLARGSHGKLGMLVALAFGCPALTGCLVADAPEYGPPQKRPPVIDSQSVAPSPYETYLINESSPPMNINVPVRSEDAGDDLVGALYVDYNADEEPAFWDQPIPASSFDDLERSWSYTFRPDSRVERRCGHKLTLFLMHASSFDGTRKIPKDVPWDIASVTWQLNVFPDNANVIESCLGEQSQ